MTQSMWAALLIAVLVLAVSFLTAQAAVLFESNRKKAKKKDRSNAALKQKIKAFFQDHGADAE